MERSFYENYNAIYCMDHIEKHLITLNFAEPFLVTFFSYNIALLLLRESLNPSVWVIATLFSLTTKPSQACQFVSPLSTFLG